jgi:2-oxo-4-hydroxy-4-carboxy-5-ureidoimidazoline decarboxylase
MTLHEFNTLSEAQLREELYKCCGSHAWVDRMIPLVPAEDLVELLEDAEEQWWQCSEKDWREAFSQHPRIGESASLQEKFRQTAAWAATEQAGMKAANRETLKSFEEANQQYEEKFGYTFIVCATGKSPDEMLGMLQVRLHHDPVDELRVAADEQSKITKLRIEKLIE